MEDPRGVPSTARCRHRAALLAPLFLAAWLQGNAAGQQPALAGVNSEDIALRVDPLGGRATRLSGVGLQGFGSVEGLTFDPSSGTLYGLDASTHELLTIDLETRHGTPVGGVGLLGLGSIAFDPGRRILYGIEVVGGEPDRLVSIDPVTGRCTRIGSTGVADVGGLAFDAVRRILYATDVGIADTLLRLDTSTGRATTVGPLGFVWVVALAFDGATSTLYGVDQQGDRVITIHTGTGRGTALSSTLGGGGFTNVRGIAVDPGDGRLYGADAATHQLIRIDKATGAGTALGSLAVRDLHALAYIPSTHLLLATDTRNDKLLSLDLTSGLALSVGDLVDSSGSRLYEVFGLAWDPYLGRLYGVDRLSRRLVTINRTNAQGTSALALRYPSGQPIYGARALGFDTASRTLYAIDCDGVQSRLVRLDPSTGVGTIVRPDAPMPYASVDGLVFLAHAGVFVGSTDNGVPSAPVRTLITIQPATGAWSETSPLGMGRVYGLVYDPVSRILGGTTGTQFYRIHVGGQGTAIGCLGVTNVEGLALDAAAGVVYGTTLGDASIPVGRLLTINRANGQGTPVGELVDSAGNRYTSVMGLAFDPATRTLYGSDTLRDQLLRIDRFTGRVTPVGSLGFQEIQGLAFQPGTGVLFGVDGATDQLVRVNTATGRATAVGALGFPDVEGLELETVSGVLYGTDVQTLQLIRIHTGTGAGSAVGSTGYKIDGLAGRIL